MTKRLGTTGLENFLINPGGHICTATSLDGFLSTSPTPPPLRSPWLSTVTMHMSSVSHVCSWSCSVSSAGGSSADTARG